MKEGPDIVLIGSLVGDPARANILTALLTGHALTATELAAECGVTPQTTSSHLAKLEKGGLLTQRKQGRHRYFTLSGDDVGAMLESMMGLAASRGHLRVRPGPRDPALRKARICYDHLAGTMGVALFESLRAQRLIRENQEDVVLTAKGRAFAAEFGIDLEALEKRRRPLCKSCLDWSARRSHLAGVFGAALLERIFVLKWAKRIEDSRVIAFTKGGEKAFQETFAIAPP